MALAVADLAEIERMLAVSDAPAQILAALRKRFPTLACIRCDASDVAETPFRTIGGFDLHLLDSADHCAAITDDPARATGIVLARREDRS